MFKIVNASEIGKEKWSDFVLNHDMGTIFHTPYMYDVWSSASNHESFAYFSIDQEDRIGALLTGFYQTVKPGAFAGLARRAVMMQSPIFNNPEALKLLLSHFINKSKDKVVYSEVRNHYCSVAGSLIFTKAGFKFEDHLTIVIDLVKGEENLWKEVNSKRRNEIRKAYKEGIYVKRINPNEVDECYQVLFEVYRRANLPLVDISFFTKAIEATRGNDGMIGFGAYFEDRLIGCMLTMCYKDRIYDLYAGSKAEFYHKHPNDLIPWEVFRWGVKNGFRTFDFGGAGKPNVPYGVREYKLKFGGDLVDFGRYLMIHRPVKMLFAKAGYCALQKLHK